MKKFCVAILLSFPLFNLFAQDSNWTVDVGYPLNVGNNFFAKHNKGVLQLGLSHKVLELKNIDVAARFDFGYNVHLAGTFPNFANYNSFQLRKRFLLVAERQLTKKIFSFGGIGFQHTNGAIEYEQNGKMFKPEDFGYSVAASFRYSVFKSLYLQAMANFNYQLATIALRVPYNTHLHVVSASIGAQF